MESLFLCKNPCLLYSPIECSLSPPLTSLPETLSSKCLTVFLFLVHPQLLTLPHDMAASHFSPHILILLVPWYHAGVSPSFSSLKSLWVCPLCHLSLLIPSPSLFFIPCMTTQGLISFTIEITCVPGLPSPKLLCDYKRFEDPNLMFLVSLMST